MPSNGEDGLTLFSEVSRARTGPWLGDVQDWLASGADFSSTSLVSWMRSLPVGWSLRTSLAFCQPARALSAPRPSGQATAGATSPPCSQSSPAGTPTRQETDGAQPGTAEATRAARPGGCWTLVASEFPIDDAECSSLSSVLEPEPVPSKFYLTPRAAKGVLRRAAKRNRTLPQPLHDALSRLAGGGLSDDALVTTRNRIDLDTETFVAALDQRGGRR